jgi:hypothetical protein
MVIEIVIVLASILPATIVGATIAHQLTEWPPFVAVMQAIVGAVIGLAVVEFIGLAPWLVVATIIASQTINVIGASIKMWNRRQRKKALNGDYGDVTMWAVEIAQDGDPEFVMAIQALPDSEKMELGIIANDKEELRELVIERFDELADEQIPEDFA